MTSSLLQDSRPSPSPSDHHGFRPYASPKHTITRARYITSNDPRGFLPVYEYPVNGQWLMVDADNGYVLWTGIWKALGNTKADIVKMLESHPELAPHLRRVRGGYLKIQGTWINYETALRLARRVAWPIRDDLVPIFGPTFPSTCLAPNQPGYGQLLEGAPRRRPRRRAQDSPEEPAHPFPVSAPPPPTPLTPASTTYREASSASPQQASSPHTWPPPASSHQHQHHRHHSHPFPDVRPANAYPPHAAANDLPPVNPAPAPPAHPRYTAYPTTAAPTRSSQAPPYAAPHPSLTSHYQHQHLRHISMHATPPPLRPQEQQARPQTTQRVHLPPISALTSAPPTSADALRRLRERDDDEPVIGMTPPPASYASSGVAARRPW